MEFIQNHWVRREKTNLKTGPTVGVRSAHLDSRLAESNGVGKERLREGFIQGTGTCFEGVEAVRADSANRLEPGPARVRHRQEAFDEVAWQEVQPAGPCKAERGS